MSTLAKRLFAVGMSVALLNNVLMNFYQSTKKTGLATLICILENLVFTVLIASMLIKPMGSTGVWIAFLLGEIVAYSRIVCHVQEQEIFPEDLFLYAFGRRFWRKSQRQTGAFHREQYGRSYGDCI